MDLYDKAAENSSREITKTFSTSFSMASKFFHKEIRHDIYNIYGLVRLADEVVDTYDGSDSGKLLTQLEAGTYHAIKQGFSTNPVIHAFALTARKSGIARSVIEPFFASMREDLTVSKHDKASYDQYIYGSAEVVGLMCLSVFVDGDHYQYRRLETGAKALGSAFQKVNFLRDLAEDHEELGRFYFPNTNFDKFNNKAKKQIEDEILKEFKDARKAVVLLPDSSRTAVAIAYEYYFELLKKIQKTDANELKQGRVRLNDSYKFWLMLKVWVTQR